MENIINRESYQEVDFRDIEIEKRHKPSQEHLKQLKYIKKLRLENKKLFYSYETIEQDIGFLLSQNTRGKKEELIKLIIFKLQELQIQKKIIDFSRAFLRNLFKEYSNLSDRVIQLRMEELLIYAKARERVKTNYHLVNKQVDKIREPRNKIYLSYSFI